MSDLISRQAAIDEIKALYEWHDTVTEDRTIDHLKRLPSAQPELSEIKRDLSDLISRQATYLALVEKGQASKRYKLGETWELNGKEIREVLDALPSVQPDLSGYSDRLWKAAYERGKAEAQADITHCGECKHRDPEDHKCDCGHDILWQLPRDDEWYCADAKRKESEADADTEV